MHDGFEKTDNTETDENKNKKNQKKKPKKNIFKPEWQRRRQANKNENKNTKLLIFFLTLVIFRFMRIEPNNFQRAQTKA